MFDKSHRYIINDHSYLDKGGVSREWKFIRDIYGTAMSSGLSLRPQKQREQEPGAIDLRSYYL
jgi:hypothetical protein